MQEEQKYKEIKIDKDNESILIGTYGTLRVGHGNWSRLLKDQAEFLGTFKTEPKFTMSGKNSGFPIVFREGGTAIEYDLFKVTKASVLKNLHALEGCSGKIGHPSNWYDLEELENEKHGTFYIYAQNGSAKKENIIESGNWNNR